MNIKELIARDGRYKSICKGLAKKDHLTDELLSEFYLAICEMSEDDLIKAQDGGYLEVYCVGIINNIWNVGNRLKIKKNVNGKTSPFFDYANYSVESPVFVSTQTYDIKTDYLYLKAVEKIKEDNLSPEREKMYKSRVFHYSVNEFKNPRQFAKHSKIPYGAVFKTYKQYKEYLKEYLKKFL